MNMLSENTSAGKILLISFLTSLKLMAATSLLAFFVYSAWRAVYYFMPEKTFYLWDYLEVAYIIIFYCGIFIGVLSAYILVRKEHAKIQNGFDADLNRISEEVKSLEDKINQINI